MPGSMFDIYALLPTFLLILFRIGGLMVTTPFFSAAAVPSTIRVCLAVAISLAVFPLMVGYVTVPVTMASAVIGLIGELSLGLLIGLSISLVFLGVQVAAEMVGRQSGMHLGDLFNPMFESESGLIAQVYYMVALLIFLAVGGHQAVMRAVMDSFATIPPLSFHMSEAMLGLIVDLLALSFTMAIRIGGPAMLALLLSYMTLGFISRTMPQMNILTIGFPIKLALGILIMAITIVSLESVFLETLAMGIDGLRATLGLTP